LPTTKRIYKKEKNQQNFDEPNEREKEKKKKATAQMAN